MYKLIMCIVPHNSGELITNAAKQAGAGGGTIIMGRGTASNSVLQLLGLGILQEAYEKAADAAELIVRGDVEGAQSRFNKRHEKNPRQNQQEA